MMGIARVKIKRCISCDRSKGNMHFRIINRSRRHTSKTCRDCEALIGIDIPDNDEVLNGYMYVLFDTAHPEWIKIGCTVNLKSRLSAYNKQSPDNTCTYVYVSKRLKDIFNIERILLRRIYKYIRASTGTKEWFPVRNKEILVAEIKRAEDIIK